MPKVTRKCDHCGAEYSRTPSHIGRFCSQYCAYAGRRKDRVSARRMIYAPGHPLTLNSPYIPEYRALLYEVIGPGQHPCRHCGTPVRWTPGGKSSPGALVVDHLDRNPLNNAVANLAPSCQRCNILNSDRTVQDDEDFRVIKNGTRLRGEARNCERCGTRFVAHPDPRPGRGRFCSRSCARKKPRTA